VANIIIPGKWTSQPQYPAELTGDFASNGIWLYSGGSVNSDLSKSKAGSAAVTNVGVGLGGRGAVFTTGAGGVKPAYVKPSASVGETTWYSIFAIKTAVAWSSTIYARTGDDNGGITFGSDGLSYRYVYNGDEWSYDTGLILTPNKLMVVAHSVSKINNRVICALNGRTNTRDSAGVTTNRVWDFTLSSAWFGQDSGDVGRTLNGVIFDAGFLNRALNEAELREFTSNPYPFIFKSRPQILYFDVSSGAVTHDSTGALTADNAVIAGSSVHSLVHPSTGALSAQNAVVAGTSAHVAMHPSTGALTADNAVIAGTAARIANHQSTGALSAGDAVVSGDAANTASGVVTHPSTGVLTADSAVVAGTAVHVVNHQTTGALLADSAVIDGTVVHNITHATTGALSAGSATVDGLYSGGTAAVAPPAGGGGTSTVSGKRAKRQKLILVDTIEEIDELLEQVEEIVQSEPKARKLKLTSKKPVQTVQSAPEAAFDWIKYYDSKLDTLRDQQRAISLKRQLDKNAELIRQILAKQQQNATIEQQLQIQREEEDFLLLLMAA